MITLGINDYFEEIVLTLVYCPILINKWKILSTEYIYGSISKNGRCYQARHKRRQSLYIRRNVCTNESLQLVKYPHFYKRLFSLNFSKKKNLNVSSIFYSTLYVRILTINRFNSIVPNDSSSDFIRFLAISPWLISPSLIGFYINK